MPLRYNERTGMFDDVPYDLQIRSFTFEGTPIRYTCDIVVLKFDVNDAEKIFIDDERIRRNASSHRIALLTSGIKTIVLRAENGGLQKTESLQIKVLDHPIFNIEQSTDKLRKNKFEQCVVKWTVDNAKLLKIRENGRELTVGNHSEMTFSPDVTTDYEFVAIGLDGQREFSQIVHIGVFEESTVTFEVDKEMTLAYVPIRLSWDVQNAINVELTGFGEVNHRGEKVVELTKEKEFVLSFTDAFGTKDYKKNIKMFPLPLIKSILVPMLQIEKKIVVETHFERKNIQVNINTNIDKIPHFNGINSDAFVSTIPFHKLKFNGKRNIWQKLSSDCKSIIENITNKMSTIWNK